MKGTFLGRSTTPKGQFSERGSVVVFTVIVITVFTGMIGLIIDLGKTWQDERDIQFAVDSAALAAVEKLRAGLPNEAVPEAQLLAQQNGVSLSEIAAAGQIVVGTWSSGAGFAPVDLDNPVEAAAANAVAVPAQRTNRAYFSQVLGAESYSPEVYTVAAIPITTTTISVNSCLRPFGIESASYSDLGEIDWGSTVISIGNNSPANWGKLDLGGNMSSGKNFEEAMLNGACDLQPEPYVGQGISPGTGFGGPIGAIFDAIYALGAPHTTLMIAVVDEFPNGNSGLVTIERFLLVELMDVTIGKGKNWGAMLRLISEHFALSEVQIDETVTTWGERILVQ